MSAPLVILTAAELMALPLPDPRNPDLWGGWGANFKRGTLYHAAEDYEIDLDECLTAGGVLDWLMQVAGKTWATPEVLAGLVHLVDRLVDPQGTVCRGRELTTGWWRSPELFQ